MAATLGGSVLPSNAIREAPGNTDRSSRLNLLAFDPWVPDMAEPRRESESVRVGGEGRNRGSVFFNLHAKLSIAMIELSNKDFARIRNANGPYDLVSLSDNA